MLNEEQESAVRAIVDHCKRNDSNKFLIFRGPAGTGKTFCMQEVKERVKKRIVFTAPTNKATKVLRDSLKTEDYRPDCRTIYSLLGLKMEANGEIKELAVPDDDVDLSSFSVVVIDEGSMVNQQLWSYVENAAETHPDIRWVIMGDAWQLPPVGEEMSPVWSYPQQIELTKIMRQDNQILRIASRVRGNILTPYKPLQFVNDFAADLSEGVWSMSTLDLTQRVQDDAAGFLAGRSKFIAWRNVQVDRFNNIIRARLFAEHDKYPWQPGDRLTLLGPADDVIKDENGRKRPLGHTDDEGVVEKAELAEHPEHGDFMCWRIVTRMDDNRLATLWTLKSSEQGKFQNRLQRLAGEARDNRRLWYKYWEFRDAFHPVRHAYAITAHRAQGSTYENAYVYWRDILLNQNRAEAYRCLYVAVTRPRKKLFLG
jgi:exodeoxyribonuclease-5